MDIRFIPYGWPSCLEQVYRRKPFTCTAICFPGPQLGPGQKQLASIAGDAVVECRIVFWGICDRHPQGPVMDGVLFQARHSCASTLPVVRSKFRKPDRAVRSMDGVRTGCWNVRIFFVHRGLSLVCDPPDPVAPGENPDGRPAGKGDPDPDRYLAYFRPAVHGVD